MKRAIITLLFFIGTVAAQAQQTYNITGIVTDEKDAPIAGATVFLADSRKATVSDGEGKFALQQVQPGKYNLVVKMIGYVVTMHEFMLQNNNMRFRVKLPEDNVMLNTVEISAMSLAERKRHLQTFLACFLGTSKYAKECKILNPDDIKLKFDKKRNILTASSNDFLVIENKALGYTMKYLLNNFVFDRQVFNENLLSFDGTLFFEEMKASNRQVKKWEEERVKTYLGSSTHFFKSLLDNTLDNEGFMVYRMLNRQALTIYSKKQQKIPDAYFSPFKDLKSYVTDVDDNFKIFDTGRLKKDSLDLFVVYTAEKEPVEFIERGDRVKRFFEMPAGQTSFVQVVGDSVLLSKTGIMATQKAVWFTGFWTWGRVSAFLPTDYEVPANIDPRKKKQVVKPILSAD